MNTLRRLSFRMPLVAALLALAACATPAARKADLPERVQVAWAPNDKLAEVKDNPSWRGWLKPADWQKSLSEHLRKRADHVLPAGEQLKVTIDDIKLAGDYEPWRGPNAQDIRFLTDLYPPRVDLHYTLIAADGSTLREGASKLRDMGYLQRITPFENDPLRFDKRLFDDWLAKEFKRSES
jgi:hypothetical protein